MLYVYQHEGHRHMLRAEGPDVLRTLCHPKQIHILAAQYGRQEIEVVSINHFDMKRMKDPDYVLERMATLPEIPAERGGYRKLERPEFAALQFSAVGPQELEKGLCPHQIALLDKHPVIQAGLAYPFGGFVGHATLQLLMYCYDMRRFTVPDCDSAQSSLLQFFHLTTKTKLENVVNNNIATEDTLRTAMAYNAWNLHPFTNLNVKQVKNHKCAVFFRYCMDEMERQPDNMTHKKRSIFAVWAATCYFMKFFELLWLEGVGGPKFKPAEFFKHETFVEGFTAFINRPDFRLDNC